MTTATKHYRDLTRHDVLREGMRVAVVAPYRAGRSKLVHVGRVVQVFGDGAHVEYDYQPGVRHLHLSESMIEVLEGSRLMEPQPAPIDTTRTPA